MPVTGVSLVERDENYRQIERLVSSSVLQGSESLCKLLRYLADHALEHSGVPVKEYQIATEVFGRPSYFDPRLDSTVRVQTGRLRSKLAEYYANAGAEDPVIVGVRKGFYALTFHARPVTKTPVMPMPTIVAMPAPLLTAEPPTAVKPEPKPVHPANARLVIALVGVIMALSVTALALAYVVYYRPASAVNAAPKTDEASILHTFWKSFVDNAEYPWAVFSNAEFTGRPETGMRYFNAATDASEAILDHYTGVGEVLAIHELDRVFTLLNHGLRVKRGRLLSLDDAKNNDLIFVGSPSENLPLREIPTSSEFVFRRTDLPERKGDLAIINVHPKEGEQRMYFASPPGRPLTEDYAVIALVPGMYQSRSVLVLAGTTTIGTQAAVEYVCRARTVENLMLKLNGSKTADVTPFEAVLKVKVTHGVPVQSSLVAVHPR